MNTRPIDKTKSSNIKCEHCESFCDNQITNDTYCSKKNESTQYWNRCKLFGWNPNLKYKE